VEPSRTHAKVHRRVVEATPSVLQCDHEIIYMCYMSIWAGLPEVFCAGISLALSLFALV
jgi:hypothetical protein